MTTPSFADHIFTPWRAEADRRIVASESHWREPVAWNQQAHLAAELWDACKDDPKYAGRVRYDGRPRVLVGCEVFEDWQGPMLDESGDRLTVYKPNGGLLPVRPYADEPGPHCRWLTMPDVRQRLFDLIAATPHLDWLIATEHTENVLKMMDLLAEAIGHYEADEFSAAWHSRVWLGVIVSNQAEADARIPELLKVPAARRWVWLRDLKEDIDLSRFHIGWSICENCGEAHDPNEEHPLGSPEAYCFTCGLHNLRVEGHHLHLLAISGSTGPDAPPTDLRHVRSIVRQGQSAGVPVWVDDGEEWPKRAPEDLQ